MRCTGSIAPVALCEAHPASAASANASRSTSGAARRARRRGRPQGAVADIRRVIDAARAGGERDQARDALIQLGMAYRRADAYERRDRLPERGAGRMRAP